MGCWPAGLRHHFGRPAKIKQVPKVAQSARLDFLSGIVTIDEAMIALIELSNLLKKPEAAAEETVSTH